jgi:2-hydroxy-6-oxonona-2,4-dienedioate hydrolase
MGQNDNLIPIEHSKLFKQALKKSKVEEIKDTGHAHFAEKPALICEILHPFLSQNN